MVFVINSTHDEVLVMVLCLRQFIFLLSYTFYIKTFFVAASSSSDDDNLKEALLLVDLLKSEEYFKALRNNDDTNDGEDQNRDASEEQLTCAPTTDDIPVLNISQRQVEASRAEQRPDVNLYSNVILTQATAAPNAPLQYRRFRNLDQPLSAEHRPDVNLSSHLIQPQATAAPQGPFQYRRIRNFYQPLRALRRRIPRDFYYYYYDTPRNDENGPHYRRFDSDPFGEHPADSNPAKGSSKGATSSTTNFTSTSTTQRTTDRASSARAPSSTRQESASAKTSVDPPASTKAKPQSTPHKKSTIKSNKLNTKKLKLKATVSKNEDPVSGQVAAELANEIKHIDNENSKGDKIRNPSTKKYAQKHVSPTSSVSEGTVLKRNTHAPLGLARTTLRIHLERSTRYPIPFPENHAFCFTNPNSALCRTLI